ncbi:hypothetical protein [Rhizobium sp. BK251]|uniref:hypothetical protein n=1 Tax=Rhizobium sp. BK251 TaxID=2512125 RepID=UPI001042EDB2|nr:hypothetical protein [Rhizobium sp. BK251]
MRAIATGLAALLLPAAVLAAEPGGERFQLERSGDNFVRLDKQTGAMSICAPKDGELVCRMAADERAAYEDELDRLSARVATLEKAVGEGAGKGQLPTDAEVDRTLGIMERMMRGFMAIVRELQGEGENDKILPQKT